jgi:hypothetical protein
MEIFKTEMEIIENKVEKVEPTRLADLDLVLVGGGMGDVAF